MYITLLVANIILMLFIIYGKIRTNLATTKGKNILFGCGIFCTIGSVALIETQEASIFYSISAIIIYGIYIWKSGIFSELNFNYTTNKENNINNSTYTTTDGILVDDNDDDSIIIYRPVGAYMSLEDTRLVDKRELPKLKPSNLILQNDEYCCFMDNGKTFKQKVVTTGYVNNRQGGSVRIMKGVSYHTGTGQSRAIRETQTEIFDGTIYITNKRLIYVSKGGDSFDKAIPKLTSVEEAEDGVIIQIGAKTYSIILDTHVLFMQIFNIVKNKEYDIELPEIFDNKNVQYTIDENVIKKMKGKSERSQNKMKTKHIIIAIIIILFIIMIGLGEMKTENISTNSKTTTYENLSNESKDIVDKFIKVRFSKDESIKIYDILKQCDIGVFSEDELQKVDKNDRILKEKKYDKAYSCYAYDKKVSEYRNIYIYFTKNEVVYICSSNHVIDYYSKKEGVINDSHRLFVN